MSATPNERPQDAERKHTRKRNGSANRALVERYNAAMRDELGRLLDELTPKPAEKGLGLVDMPPVVLSITDRTNRWTLAIKLGRELGAAIDPDPSVDRPPTITRPTVSPKRIDYGE